MPPPPIITIPPRRFLLACLLAAAFLLALGCYHPFPHWLIALQVFATVIALFIFGSSRYRLDKNALTYGSVLLTLAMFLPAWWPTSSLRADAAALGPVAWWRAIHHHLLTFHGLDNLVHADTMLFLLGLTLFVSVIAQTRLLESVTLFLLRKNQGRVLPTILTVTAVVAAASGILDGVSMIGLTIRTLVIILLLAQAPLRSIRFAVIACTLVTTVNGIWLAYGEPPNLIMKANLHPLLDDRFFLTYCLPAAVLTYLVIAAFLVRRFRGLRVDLQNMDLLDAHAGALRFLQASRHGQVLSPIEFAQSHADQLGPALAPLLDRLRQGQPLGVALAAQGVSPQISQRLLGEFAAENLAQPLDHHYRAPSPSAASDDTITAALRQLTAPMHRAQLAGGLALLPFIACLVVHALNHQFPLFIAAFAGFAVALAGIIAIPKMRRLALSDAAHEYAEYLFLFPLFLSVTLLSHIGFFDELKTLLHSGVQHAGPTAMAVAQFWGATFLSALLDNNVVADFVSRALQGLPDNLIFLFALAQIAGYAAGGCWTHIGSAQSVVAYAFIQRDLDDRFTPLDWIKTVTRPLLAIAALLTIYILLLGYLHQ